MSPSRDVQERNQWHDGDVPNPLQHVDETRGNGYVEARISDADRYERGRLHLHVHGVFGNAMECCAILQREVGVTTNINPLEVARKNRLPVAPRT